MDGVFITLIVFAAMYAITKLIVQRKERIMLIEKITSNVDDLSAKKVADAYARRGGFSTLTIGCLLLGAGLGLVIGVFIAQCAIFPRMEAYGNGSDLYFRLREMSTMVMMASVLLFGGLGLVVAYLLEKTELRKSANKNS